VEVFNRKGRFIRQYPAGLLTASNVAFGGEKMDQLFITGALGVEGRTLGALFRLPLPAVKGLPLAPRTQP
jgi:sugar lactone lactonase YvrE